MIKAVILYILNRYDASIYRISKLIDEIFFPLLKSSAGTINPALRSLYELGCVKFVEKMSDGGMKTTIYSITPEGKKHLVELLLSFRSTNPYHIINEAKIAMYCSSVLSVNEFIEFKENILNHLELFKIKLEKEINNEYNQIDEMQKNIAKITIFEIDELIKLL